jgi:hypothetical protein
LQKEKQKQKIKKIKNKIKSFKNWPKLKIHKQKIIPERSGQRRGAGEHGRELADPLQVAVGPCRQRFVRRDGGQCVARALGVHRAGQVRVVRCLLSGWRWKKIERKKSINGKWKMEKGGGKFCENKWGNGMELFF